MNMVGFGNWQARLTIKGARGREDHFEIQSDHEVPDSERVRVWSRQDCDDLIELLRVVRERLP